MLAPFRELFALIISDGNANLPQHLLIDLADRRSQCANGSRGVEVKNRHQLFQDSKLFLFVFAHHHLPMLR